jgi:hypothetical protein
MKEELEIAKQEYRYINLQEEYIKDEQRYVRFYLALWCV